MTLRNKRVYVVLTLMSLLIVSCGFAGSYYSMYDPPGIITGLWHGLLAPYTLILRFFIDMKMYAVPNSGFGYDLGFLVGVAGSIPFGWIAAILQVLAHIFM